MGGGSGALLEFGDSVGSVLRKVHGRKAELGPNIESDLDRRYWGKNRCIAIGSW
jgi:hypothetical protein